MAPLLLLVDLQRDYLASPDLEPAAGPLVRQARTLLEGWGMRRSSLRETVVHTWATGTSIPRHPVRIGCRPS